ncbi:pyridoxal-phosphate dependent enzyme [Saprospiraceae bacterium]|jgi:1-aminocyclopropane-1-carboxylate deaminase/D-cysteine desulfhydrase-like pyridoxal-dependent ACC family enzyme|nr:pyridoxal-phosphate dependent enzyme [Bacteroidota bacterium]MDB4727409.1 pyridoxal-phosphate dependent enzyme [Saprospiraceae bacterium]MDF1867365.1 pyridoxal-phosphate dependent enzyme [Saprospiraceae bacterium]
MNIGDLTYAFSSQKSPIQKITSNFLTQKEIQLFIKRDDLIHAEISGNKWRKLKYNLIEAKKTNQSTLLTFGGAFSNHISAVAAAGAEFGFRTIGIIRGEQVLPLNPTLSFAKKCGMDLHFINRTLYRNKNKPDYQNRLKNQFGDFFLLPEGGTNCLALEGCSEIIQEVKNKHIDTDYYCVSCGTGGTISGIISGLNGEKKVLGFSALKGDFLTTEVFKLLNECVGKEFSNWEILTEYHFGGYAKWTPELINFINQLYEETTIPFDPIYTGKMLFGIYDLIRKDFFEKGSSLMVIHTGGLQGIQGFNNRFGNLIKT